MSFSGFFYSVLLFYEAFFDFIFFLFFPSLSETNVNWLLGLLDWPSKILFYCLSLCIFIFLCFIFSWLHLISIFFFNFSCHILKILELWVFLFESNLISFYPCNIILNFWVVLLLPVFFFFHQMSFFSSFLPLWFMLGAFLKCVVGFGWPSAH